MVSFERSCSDLEGSTLLQEYSNFVNSDDCTGKILSRSTRSNLNCARSLWKNWFHHTSLVYQISNYPHPRIINFDIRGGGCHKCTHTFFPSVFQIYIFSNICCIFDRFYLPYLRIFFFLVAILRVSVFMRIFDTSTI